jgi:hypothetical protein
VQYTSDEFAEHGRPLYVQSIRVQIVLAYVSEGDALLGMSLLRGSIGSFEFFSDGIASREKPL